MEDMTMNRVIHGAVRRDLRRLEEALAAVSAGDKSRAEDLHRAFGFLRDQARHAVVGAREATERHLDHEERDLEPLMLPHFESAEWKAAEKQLREPATGRGRPVLRVGRGRDGRAGARVLRLGRPGAGAVRHEPAVRTRVPPRHRPGLARLTTTGRRVSA